MLNLRVEVVVEHEVDLFGALTNKPGVVEARLDLLPEHDVNVCLWITAGVHLHDGVGRGGTEPQGEGFGHGEDKGRKMKKEKRT